MSAPQLVEVKVEQGVLRGERVPAQDDGLPYDAFRGIPYAEKPVGALRFKAPRPLQPWEGVRPALEEGPMAPQLGSGGKVVGSEDCLYLNVYTPQVPSSVAIRSPHHRAGAPWPIMFWLHPGAYVSGSGSPSEYGPDLLVAKNVVVVTVNYRLAALGFLSLESPAATGNYGLKDQLAALRWVKRNGSAFGGDVNNVTIFGCSAGGASVQHLQVSPAAKGLFHRAIATSGSALNPWAFVTDARSRTLRLARNLGASESDLADDEQILEFLRRQPAAAIVQATFKVPPDAEDAPLILSGVPLPTSEAGLVPDDPLDEIFLPGHPRELMKRQGRVTDVPLMMGFCDAEGMLVDLVSQAGGIKAVPEVFAKYDAHLELTLPTDLRKVFPDGSSEQKDAVKRIRDAYFQGGPVCEATRHGYYNLMGDLLINTGVLQEARTHAQHSNHSVYVFTFAVKGKINKISSRLKGRSEELPGACHADELNYLWTSKPPIPKLEPESLEAQTRHRMVTLWTNFAKTGNPTPENETTLGEIRWPAVPKNVSTSIPYLRIGETLSNPPGGLLKERVQLWDSLYSELK